MDGRQEATMPTQVFISHSVAPRELAIVNSVADVAVSRGAVPIIPDRDWTPDVKLPPRIESQINSSSFVVGIVTSDGHQLDWVNSEMGYGMVVKKPIIALADADVTIPPEFRVIRIDRADPLGTIAAVSAEIQRRIRDERTKKLFGGLAIGGLVLLLLASLKGE